MEEVKGREPGAEVTRGVRDSSGVRGRGGENLWRGALFKNVVTVSNPLSANLKKKNNFFF